MPQNVDEAIWKKAKKKAKESENAPEEGTKAFWKYVQSIYQKMDKTANEDNNMLNDRTDKMPLKDLSTESKQLIKTAFQAAGGPSAQGGAGGGGGGMPPMMGGGGGGGMPPMMGGGGGGMPPIDPSMLGGGGEMPESAGGAPGEETPDDAILVSESELTDKLRSMLKDVVGDDKEEGSSDNTSKGDSGESGKVKQLEERIASLEAQLGATPAPESSQPNAPTQQDMTNEAVKEMFTPEAQQDLPMASPEENPAMSKQASENILDTFNRMSTLLNTLSDKDKKILANQKD